MRLIDTRHPFTPPGGPPSYCRLRIYACPAPAAASDDNPDAAPDEAPAPRHLVIFTELRANPGVTVTQATAFLAAQVCVEYNLDPATTVFVEHWAAVVFEGEAIPESFAQVTYTWRGGGATAPMWRALAVEVVERLAGAEVADAAGE